MMSTSMEQHKKNRELVYANQHPWNFQWDDDGVPIAEQVEDRVWRMSVLPPLPKSSLDVVGGW